MIIYKRSGEEDGNLTLFLFIVLSLYVSTALGLLKVLVCR